MTIKIAQSFIKVNHAPFSAGEVLTVPDDVASEWIAEGKAIALTDPTQQHIEGKAAIRKRIKNKVRERTAFDS